MGFPRSFIPQEYVNYQYLAHRTAPGQDTKNASTLCLNAGKKTWNNPGSGQLPFHEGYKAHGFDSINDKLVAAPTDPLQELMLFANRQHQYAAIVQLRQQRGRNFRRRGGNDDRVERRACLPTLPSIAVTG